MERIDGGIRGCFLEIAYALRDPQVHPTKLPGNDVNYDFIPSTACTKLQAAEKG
jgi:hypothetical protein